MTIEDICLAGIRFSSSWSLTLDARPVARPNVLTGLVVTGTFFLMRLHRHKLSSAVGLPQSLAVERNHDQQEHRAPFRRLARSAAAALAISVSRAWLAIMSLVALSARSSALRPQASAVAGCLTCSMRRAFKGRNTGDVPEPGI